jgi:hypothetical protein
MSVVLVEKELSSFRERERGELRFISGGVVVAHDEELVDGETRGAKEGQQLSKLRHVHPL